MFSNHDDVPLSVALWLALDDYVPNPDIISASQFIKPVRKLILEHRIKTDPPKNVSVMPVELSELMKSRKGTAVHSAIELAWNDPEKRIRGLMALGYSEAKAKNFVVNVPPEKLRKGQIPIYTELYCESTVAGYGVGGTADFVLDGQLTDFKNTSTFSYNDPKKIIDYRIQGSVYRFAEPKIITKDTIQIVQMYDDWSRAGAYKQSYPPARIMAQNIALWSIPQTRKFMTEKINTLVKYMNAEDHEIPLCSDLELWRTPDTYKYYSKEDNKKSSGNFETFEEAAVAKRNKGDVGVIKHVKGKAKACNWCDARPICGQAKRMALEGELDDK